MNYLLKIVLLFLIFIASPSFSGDAIDIKKAKYFSILSLPPIPIDNSNKFQFDYDAINLGKELFFDPGLSETKKVSCATCHVTKGEFVPNESMAAGKLRSFRSSMQIEGAGYNTFFFWDGRADSLWAQALEPLENPMEHNFPRFKAVLYVLNNYRPAIELLSKKDSVLNAHFNTLNQARLSNTIELEENSLSVDYIFSLIGKAIASFLSNRPVSESKWDQIVLKMINNNALANDEKEVVEGFTIFEGKAMCGSCHTGSLYSDFSFHNTAMPKNTILGVEGGRYEALIKLKDQEFGCFSNFSDAEHVDCKRKLNVSHDLEANFGAFKTPILRGVSKKTKLGHSGQFDSLEEMILHYQKAPTGSHGKLFGVRTFSELKPFELTPKELDSLLAFLRAI